VWLEGGKIREKFGGIVKRRVFPFFSLFFRIFVFPHGLMCASTHFLRTFVPFELYRIPIKTFTRAKRGLGRWGKIASKKACEISDDSGQFYADRIFKVGGRVFQ